MSRSTKADNLPAAAIGRTPFPAGGPVTSRCPFRPGQRSVTGRCLSFRLAGSCHGPLPFVPAGGSCHGRGFRRQAAKSWPPCHPPAWRVGGRWRVWDPLPLCWLFGAGVAVGFLRWSLVIFGFGSWSPPGWAVRAVRSGVEQGGVLCGGHPLHPRPLDHPDSQVLNRAGVCWGGSGPLAGMAGPALFGAGPVRVLAGRGLRGCCWGRVSRVSRAGPTAGSPPPRPGGRWGRVSRVS